MKASTQQTTTQSTKSKGEIPFHKSEKQKDVRSDNIIAAKAVADVVRTSLGPRGMDKMIQDSKGEVLISNDGATILKQMEVVHPTAKMLVEISKAQDVEAGDGTTSVVVIAGALLNACQLLLEKGIHPTSISEGFQVALDKSLEILNSIAKPIDINDKEALKTCVVTSLSSKIVSASSDILAPIAVEAVHKIIDPKTDTNVDLRDIKVVKKVGGTIDDCKLLEGVVLPGNRPSGIAGGPTRFENAKVALCQFQLSSPKANMDNNIIVKDYAAMDRILKEERKYIAELVKTIVKAGVDVLLLQKSVMRDATNDLALHFLAKKNIMLIKDIEREDVPFLCKTLEITPVAHIEHLTPERCGKVGLVEEETFGEDTKILRISGGPKNAKTVSILVRGSNNLVVDEAERSLHDALCVVRSLVKNRGIIPGGGAPEIEIAQKLGEYARTLTGIVSLVVRSFADALEVIPYTLAENAGLSPINVVTELRNRHINGEKECGINVKKGICDNMLKSNVIQPALVTQSALTLSTECVRMILKIDDLVLSAR